MDVWAFGWIVSYLYSGFLPGTSKYANSEPVIQSCLITRNSLPIPDNIDNDTIREIIKKSTIVDYTKSSTMKDIRALIEKN